MILLTRNTTKIVLKKELKPLVRTPLARVIDELGLVDPGPRDSVVGMHTEPIVSGRVKKKKRKYVRFRPFRPWEFAGFEEHLTSIKLEALKFVERSKRAREERRQERERKRQEKALSVEAKLRRKMEPYHFLEGSMRWFPRVIDVPDEKPKQVKRKKVCSLRRKSKLRVFKPTRGSIVIETLLFRRWLNRQVKGTPSQSRLKIAWGHYPIVVPYFQLWRTWKRKAVKWNPRKSPVFRGTKDIFFKPFNPLWRPMTPWEKWRAIERWRSRVFAIDLAAKGKKADLWASDEFPNKITAKRRIHLVRRIFNHFLPALSYGFGWKNYPSVYQRSYPVGFWVKQGWKSFPFGYYRWFSSRLTDYHLQRYHWKLRMTLTVGTTYYKKKQIRERKVEAWRANNMDKWLAMVRQDPRRRFFDITEENYVYKQGLEAWASEQKDFVSLFRGIV